MISSTSCYHYRRAFGQVGATVAGIKDKKDVSRFLTPVTNHLSVPLLQRKSHHSFTGRVAPIQQSVDDLVLNRFVILRGNDAFRPPIWLWSEKTSFIRI